MIFSICPISNHYKLRFSLSRYFDLFLFLISSSNRSYIYIYVYISSHYLWCQGILAFWLRKSSNSWDLGIGLPEWPMGGDFLMGKRSPDPQWPHVLLPNQQLKKHLTDHDSSIHQKLDHVTNITFSLIWINSVISEHSKLAS